MQMRPACIILLCLLSASGLLCSVTGQLEPAKLEPARHKHKASLKGSKHNHGGPGAVRGLGGPTEPLVPQQHADVGVQAVKSSSSQPQATAQCGQGKIAYVKCWLDSKGYVSGVAFEDTEGTVAPSLCDTRGESQEGGFLYDGETILEIISCRGPNGGITHMEFHTDGNRVHPITCGRGGQAAETAEAEEGESVESKEWCESLTQGHMPQGAFEISNTGPRQTDRIEYDFKEVYPIAGLTARCSSQGQIVSFKNNCWSSETNRPNVHNPVLVEAWVQLNDGPSEIVKNPVQQEECSEELCADSHTSRQLSAWSATALPHLLDELGSRHVWIKHSIFSCKSCSKSTGTMLQVALALYAQQGGLDTLEHTLKAMLAWPEKNLCRYKNVVIGCEQEGVGMFKLVNVWVKSTKAPQLMLT